MDASTPMNRSGKVMVSIAGLRRLLSNNNQAEIAEEMLVGVISDRVGMSGYRLAGLAADCPEIKWIIGGKPNYALSMDFPTCGGSIYLDRERQCDECGHKVNADQVAAWIQKGIKDGTIVKSYTNMDTAQFWDDIWADFDRIDNANAGELARMVGK